MQEYIDFLNKASRYFISKFIFKFLYFILCIDAKIVNWFLQRGAIGNQGMHQNGTFIFGHIRNLSVTFSLLFIPLFLNTGDWIENGRVHS